MARRELFVWPDVDALLRELMENAQWPDWLLSASAYSHSLAIEVIAGTSPVAIEAWMTSTFGTAYRHLHDRDQLILSSGKIIPIEVDFVKAAHVSQLKLLFDQSPVIRRPAAINGKPQADGPVIYAFHSFKGGVGRTTSAIALAQGVAASADGARVLLIDADLEAPGISFLIEERWAEYPASFSDLLVIANEGQDYVAAAEVIRGRIDGLSIDGVHFLPAYRGGVAFDDVAVRPEHLIKNSRNPFVLSDLIRCLGKALNVDAVIVDLRAGVSEIAAGLALDPTVKRVLVTTLSGQSFVGTKRLLERLGRWDRMLARLSGTDDGFESPHIIFSQVREETLALAEEVYVAEALAAYMPTNGSDFAASDILRGHPGISIVPYHGDLSSLAPTWEKASAAIRRSDIVSSVKTLLSPIIAGRAVQSAAIGDTATAEADDRNEQRRKIEIFSDSLEFAESGTGQGFLVTDAIDNLVRDFRTTLPSVPVIGKKGAGKSYMFLQLVRAKTWGGFCKRAGVDIGRDEVLVFPVLAPINLQSQAESLVEGARDEFARHFSREPRDLTECRDIIRRAQQTIGEDESEWRLFWLDLIGKSAGFDDFSALASDLRARGVRALLVVDGLEDIFQSLHEDRNQQAALRSLMSEVIVWVAKNAGDVLGFLCFVRHDMVASTIRQNFGQFFQRYKQYALRWGRVEALRLVGWVADQSGALAIPSEDESDEAEMSQLLIPLWGQKLGSPNANEAHTAEWVLAALSDFKGQVQARDVVRFMKISASKSQGASAWGDRILIPQAIRSAPEICGQKKVEEVEQESPSLKTVFEMLREAAADRRVIPFNPTDFSLTVGQLELLEREGVVLREQDGYYMPEMYRQGLGFTLPRGARPRVLALARRAKSAGTFL